MKTITRGVQRLHVDEGNDTAVQEPLDCDDADGDEDCNFDNLPEIRPLRSKVRNGGASAKKCPTPRNRRNKKMDEDTGKSDGEGDRNFWSVGDTIALVRAKRDQDLYIVGLGHSLARMKTREWKWEGVRARLQTMGVTRKAIDCGKKWDNLMQQFKKVHKFQNLSGGKYYFKLASSARRSEGNNFVMDRSVYDDMEAVTKGDHTIQTRGRRGGFRCRQARGLEGNPWPGRERGCRHVPKARRFRSEEASGSVPPRRAQTWAIADEGDDDDVVATKEEALEDTVSALRGRGRQRSSDQSIARRLVTPPSETQHVSACDTAKAKEVVDVGSEDDEPLESRRQRNVTRGATTTVVRARGATEERPPQGGLPSTPSQQHPRNTTDEGGSMERGGGGEIQQEVRVVVGGPIAVPGAGTSSTVAPVARVGEELLVVEREVARGEKKAGDLPCDGGGEYCSARLARLGLQVRECPPGYNLALQYSLESVATDIARAMWYGEEWSNIVSAAVCMRTIDLSMDLTLWFAGANIEDRPKDDDMAAYQESTVICITHAFRAAVQMGANVDGGLISHDRLSRVADCFKLLLAASMRLMRMAGDDLRSHYEAFYFTKLVAKPTLVPSMHRSFEHRRSVIRATNVVTERLGKANATLGEHPKYIPN
ncbi:hypothetical protein CBR_g19281 [Chara braunii]|uniref:Myb/SANT-like DNA-binding domain-containing protein n=1 Tax=Chara braunii TaxID=69332 RepID=A0A388KXI0_CHABU|nr:hypothetical protein CBR_g19281 [Chara braunii]|eukprot:GBG74769.1 hypothetical protein CBR_g19281 [Chara braunii]